MKIENAVSEMHFGVHFAFNEWEKSNSIFINFHFPGEKEGAPGGGGNLRYFPLFLSLKS